MADKSKLVLVVDGELTSRQRAGIREQAGQPVEFRPINGAAWCPTCRELLDVTEAEMHNANKIVCTKCSTVVKDRGAPPALPDWNG